MHGTRRRTIEVTSGSPTAGAGRSTDVRRRAGGVKVLAETRRFSGVDEVVVVSNGESTGEAPVTIVANLREQDHCERLEEKK